MSDQDFSLKLENTGHHFDHPEAVAWGPDGKAYAGGEAGQVYRFELGKGQLDHFATVEGGFVLGMAHDAAGNTYACDEFLACVNRITPAGEVSVYSNGNAERKMRVPNYPVFDDSGCLYVSDSGDFGERNGLIWKLEPNGEARVWCTSANGFTNGMCLSADGDALYVVESSPPLISRVEIEPDGSAGARTVLVELPRQVPDGVALDEAGNLYIAMFNPNIIYQLTPNGTLHTLIDDWQQLQLLAPTNVAFGGPDRKTLIISSLCGWSVHTAPMPVAGVAVRYPELTG